MKHIVPTLYSVGRLPFLAEFAGRLETELGWQPAYWITQPELENEVAERFPKAILHDFTAANRGEQDPISKIDLPPFDPALLVKDGLIVRQGLEVVARHVLGKVLSVDQQASFFFERLEYAIGVTKALNLEVFVINSSPHSVMEYCFYAAFRLLGKKVRLLHLTGFRGLQVVLPEVIADPAGIDKNLATEADLSDESAAELKEIFAPQIELVPWYVTQQQEKDQKHEKLNAAADRILDENRYASGFVDFDHPAQVSASPKIVEPENKKRWSWTKQQAAPEPMLVLEDAFKRKFVEKHDDPMRRAFIFRPTGYRGEYITWRHYYTYRDWALISKRRWKRDYLRLTEGFSFEDETQKPFVYFALHYQPERTTCPDGGIFSDQLLAIRTISQALPKGWRILVKEHPSQFYWQTEGELSRWDGYYDQINEIENVVLVPLNMSSVRLIDSCSTVATITGTVGWEACLRAKPVITLARPWYATCSGVFMAGNVEEIKDAFVKISVGERPELDAVASFLAGLEKVGHRCYLNPSHKPLYDDLSDDENLERLCKLFISAENAFKDAT